MNGGGHSGESAVIAPTEDRVTTAITCKKTVNASWGGRIFVEKEEQRSGLDAFHVLGRGEKFGIGRGGVLCE